VVIPSVADGAKSLAPPIRVSYRLGAGRGRTKGIRTRNGGEFVQREEFVGRVQQRTGLASSREAEAATRATLITLGEYLSGGEALDLASQLPQGLKEHLRRQPPDRSEIFSLNDFVQRVGEIEGVGFEEALAHARAAMGVLQEAVSRSEMEDVRRQFPSQFAPLFEQERGA
jgi:uncharacterized protein (DUF2267 family)